MPEPNMIVPLSLLILLFFTETAVGAASYAPTTPSSKCCNPKCKRTRVPNVSSPVKACNASNQILADHETQSSCDNPTAGGAYACANEQPWQIDDTTSYGFAAVSLQGEDKSTWCCACYNLTFTSGLVQNRTMVIQAVSVVSGNEENTFDLFVRMCFGERVGAL